MSNLTDEQRLLAYDELIAYWKRCIDEFNERYTGLHDHWVDSQLFSLNAAVVCLEELIKDYHREKLLEDIDGKG